MDKTEKYEFLKLISKIQVAGGGDCDELAISGARNIFGSSLQYRSPIYVLTDAGPKDATEDHLDAVKEMIISYKTPINFFLSNAGKLSSCYVRKPNFSFGSISHVVCWTGGNDLMLYIEALVPPNPAQLPKVLIPIDCTPSRMITDCIFYPNYDAPFHILFLSVLF